MVDEVTLGIVHSWEDVRGQLDAAHQSRVEALQTDTKDMAVDLAVGSVRTAIRGQLEAGVDLHAFLTTGDSSDLPDDVALPLSHALDVVKSRQAVRDYYANKGSVLASRFYLGGHQKVLIPWGSLMVQYTKDGVGVLVNDVRRTTTNVEARLLEGPKKVALEIEDSPCTRVVIKRGAHTVVDFG